MVERRTLLLGGTAIVGLVLLGALVVIGPSDFFLPEQSTQVDEPADRDGEVLKRGTFVGAAGHDVSGTVRLMRDEQGLYLRFEDYEQTQGPDVFVYVTPASTPDTKSEIAGGRRSGSTAARTAARARRRVPSSNGCPTASSPGTSGAWASGVTASPRPSDMQS